MVVRTVNRWVKRSGLRRKSRSSMALSALGVGDFLPLLCCRCPLDDGLIVAPGTLGVRRSCFVLHSLPSPTCAIFSLWLVPRVGRKSLRPVRSASLFCGLVATTCPPLAVCSLRAALCTSAVVRSACFGGLRSLTCARLSLCSVASHWPCTKSSQRRLLQCLLSLLPARSSRRSDTEASRGCNRAMIRFCVVPP